MSTPPRPVKAVDAAHVAALNNHAKALTELAEAIRAHSIALASTSGLATNAGFSMRSMASTLRTLSLPPLSFDQILHEIGACFDGQTVTKCTPLTNVVGGDPGAVASMWQRLDHWPPFRQRGLSIGPNELHHINTCGDLVQIIAYGLSQAL